MIKLINLIVGQSARIIGYSKEEDPYLTRLISLGLTRGTVITLKKIAPLRDPVEIEIRGFNLILRREEADSLYLLLL